MPPLKKFALVLFTCDNDVKVVNTKSISKIFEVEFTYEKKYKVSHKTTTGVVKQFDCTILLFSDDNIFLEERKLDYETNNLGNSKLALLRKEKKQEEEELDGSQDGEDQVEGGSEIDNSESQIIEESDEASNLINKDGSRKSTRLSNKLQKDVKAKEETKSIPTKTKTAVSVAEKKKTKSRGILDLIKKDMSSAKNKDTDEINPKEVAKRSPESINITAPPIDTQSDMFSSSQPPSQNTLQVESFEKPELTKKPTMKDFGALQMELKATLTSRDELKLEVEALTERKNYYKEAALTLKQERDHFEKDAMRLAQQFTALKLLPDLITRAEALVAENQCLKNGFKGPQKSPPTLPSTSTTPKTSSQELDFENDESEGESSESQPSPKVQLPKQINSEKRSNPDEKAAATTNDDEDVYDIGDIFEIDDGMSAKKNAFPIKASFVKSLDHSSPHRFILELLHGLYSTAYLRLHKATEATVAVGNSEKVAMDKTERLQIIGVIKKEFPQATDSAINSSITKKFNMFRRKKEVDGDEMSTAAKLRKIGD